MLSLVLLYLIRYVFCFFFQLEFLYLKLLLKIGFSAAREHWSEHHLYRGCQGNMQMSCQPCSSLPVCLKCTGRKNSYFVKSTIISLPTRFCLYLHLFLLVWCQHSIQEVKTHLDKIFSRLWPNYFFFITLWSGIKNFKLRVFFRRQNKGSVWFAEKNKIQLELVVDTKIYCRRNKKMFCLMPADVNTEEPGCGC